MIKESWRDVCFSLQCMEDCMLFLKESSSSSRGDASCSPHTSHGTTSQEFCPKWICNASKIWSLFWTEKLVLVFTDSPEGNHARASLERANSGFETRSCSQLLWFLVLTISWLSSSLDLWKYLKYGEASKANCDLKDLPGWQLYVQVKK